MAAAAVLAWAPGAALAGPAELYYERSLMVAADARCDLFEARVAAALEASAWQARGAALRSGADEAALRLVRARAENKARGAACGSADLTTAAARVKDAFQGWAKTSRMTFPGQAAPWVADRTAYRSARWKLSQNARFGFDAVTFGYAGRGEAAALVAVAEFKDGARPYAARLVMRDPARAPKPWLVKTGGVPRSALRTVMAQAAAAAEATLAPGDGTALAFRFPPRAADQISALDPRERFEIEFLFPDDTVRTARLEVGDFAAGRAFLAMGAL
ncbi:MAG TPA: hypothetical protein VD929_01960 [Caulobacteraceae bacterium]|nr:hypothetical protein [Caulobacteraceae bacterium]